MVPSTDEDEAVVTSGVERLRGAYLLVEGVPALPGPRRRSAGRVADCEVSAKRRGGRVFAAREGKGSRPAAWTRLRSLLAVDDADAVEDVA